ncbi:hypothetical protein J4G43_027765 [Bradyrhizobium barranii subsp. barranii]|uniref:Uncharacterized protein n=1 Tax=Bradyrhizobium barranii subsp. barranii TaxID=2823807 RepID=A0A939S2W3_9BRAD|nr:hypothetical protein [Bradyrhizobium barranii]UEM08575.1 hypothetical protein J4G43_027765 [Bradyrhizobium barranii subsp. barranii]
MDEAERLKMRLEHFDSSGYCSECFEAGVNQALEVAARIAEDLTDPVKTAERIRALRDPR